MVPPVREEVLALHEYIADGKWHDGLTTLREIQRVIPPWTASRVAEGRLKNPDDYTMEEKVRIGQRARARDAIANLISIGRLEASEQQSSEHLLERVSRAHWNGQQPFQIRDTEAGQLSVEAMADQLDMKPHVVRKWVENGFVPHTKGRTGIVRFTQEQQEVVRRVAQHYPGPGKIRWPVDPKSLWNKKEAAITVVCPHCDHKLTVSLAVAD